MKCRIDRTKVADERLSLNQFMSQYVIGHTPAPWVQMIKAMLTNLSDGSEWAWPNARLLITRVGDFYSVKRV